MKLFARQDNLSIRQIESVIEDRSGIAALEVAIAAPLLLILLLAIVEYGWYFVKSQVVVRSVSTISDSIQRNPDDATLQTLAYSSGLNVVNLDPTTSAPNFICAQSFASQAAANTALAAGGVCSGTTWNTTTPSGTEDNGSAYKAGDPYYVGVKGFVAYTPLTPITKFVSSYSSSSSVNVGQQGANDNLAPLVPGIQSTAIFKVGAINTAINGSGFTHIQQLNGSGSWRVPAGITLVKATIVGGGGGGEKVNDSFGGNDGGARIPSTNIYIAGGGSGAVAIAYFSGLTAGNELTYGVGAPGGGNDCVGCNNRPGETGESTFFNGVVAGGGTGGRVGSDNNNTEPGSGGSVSAGSSVGTVSMLSHEGNAGFACSYGTVSNNGGPVMANEPTNCSGGRGYGNSPYNVGYGAGGGSDRLHGVGGTIILEY